MTRFTETLVSAGLVNKVFTDTDLARVLGGSPARRYGLVNKALKKRTIIQLKRGVYFLADKYQSPPLSQFFIASHLVPHSYISLESALSHHGWIPEKVTVISSVVHGRSRTFINPLGEFSYTHIPTQPFEFLTCVTRHTVNQQPFLLATPLRALCDLIYYRKFTWDGLHLLTESLRIDSENIENININELQALKNVYRSKRILHYLNKLEDNL